MIPLVSECQLGKAKNPARGTMNFYVISFHPLPSGCFQVCISRAWISDKVTGKLGGALIGGTIKSSEFARLYVAKQYLHKHPEFVSDFASGSSLNV